MKPWVISVQINQKPREGRPTPVSWVSVAPSGADTAGDGQPTVAPWATIIRCSAASNLYKNMPSKMCQIKTRTRPFHSLFSIRCSALNVRRFPVPKNNKSLPDLAVSQGQIGDGSSPSSLSRTGIRRSLFRGRRFPDAILHGKRSYRPRSRAVRHLTMRGF